MMMQRFRLYGASELALIKQTLDLCLQHWADEWLSEACTFSSKLDTADCFIKGSQQWRARRSQALSFVHSVSNGFSKRIATDGKWCSSPVVSESSLWDEVFNDCADAFIDEILTAFYDRNAIDASAETHSVACDAKPEWAMHASGWLWLDIQIGKEVLTVMLSPEAIDALLCRSRSAAPAPMLDERVDAVANNVCKLQVVADAVELTLGELHALSPGCVIRLNNTVGQPFTLRIEEGPTVGNVYLAANGANKAVRLNQK